MPRLTLLAFFVFIITSSLARAEIGVWRCTLGPVTDRTPFFSGNLLIAYDTETTQLWVNDVGIAGIDKGFIPAKVTNSAGEVVLRWKLRLAQHLGEKIVRFAYKAQFDATGRSLTATGWVEGWRDPPAATVSGPCVKA